MTGAEIDDRPDMTRIGRDPRRKDRRQHDDNDDDRTDHSGRVAAEAMPVLIGDRDLRPGGGRRQLAHAGLPES